EIYDVMAKWDPDSLVDYGGWGIKKIKFFITNANPNIKVKVWEGPDAVEIYSKTVVNYNVNDWTEVTLDSIIPFDHTQELYVGYNVDMSMMELGGIVTATDDGPPVDNYGNLVRWNGQWLSEYNNHNLRVLFQEVVNADFTADELEVCVGGSVNFTDLTDITPVSWNWTFEGGTPATSTEQNPMVTYNSAGTFNVELVVTTSSGTNVTVLKEDYIDAVILAEAPDTPTGDTDICPDQNTTYSTNTVQYADWYDWEVTPAEAGTFSGFGKNVMFIPSDTWSGDYTIKVRAVNACGDGAWSNELNCTLNEGPTEYYLSEGGFLCVDSEGLEITLSGSDIGVDYYLLYAGDTVSGPIAGTSEEISFGYFTEEGYYTSIAFNGDCSSYMIGDALITIIDILPEAVGTPTGPETVCADTISEYIIEAVENANSYIWTIIPEEAGAIEGDSLIGIVNWNATYEGVAEIAARAQNDCGAGPSGSSLEVMAYAEPTPNIAGDELVCQYDYGTYAVDFSEYSQYEWTVSGGIIIEGEGSNEIVVYWTAPQGSINTVDVTETKIETCETVAETFEVTIDQCVGIKEMEKTDLIVYPNPAKNQVTIKLDGVPNGLVDLQLMDSKGKLVIYENHYLTSNSLKSTLNLSTLNNGLYIIVIRSKNQILIHRKLVLIR
ncbi:MAG: hypothetical protein C0598_05505, partial [Marinilabiliales bacterium]